MLGIGSYLLAGGGVAFLLLGAHDMRVNHLRAGYKENLETIRIAFVDMGEKPKGYGDLPAAANKVGAERARYRRERDAAHGLVDIQTATINMQGEETAAALRQSEVNLRLYAETKRQRDIWIGKARAAETRTQRRAAEEELKECDSVLDALYQAGF